MKQLHFTPALALAAFVCALTASPLHAQVGNQNPAGASGIFNGQVTTGCSYDPYTGNATRSITDIAVAGAVGENPLALVRTANSRTPSTTGVFGWDAGWNHNYNWTMEDSSTSNTQNSHPKRYTVNFPDGRVETFRSVTWDTCYRVRPGVDTPAQSGSAGLRERLLQLDVNPNSQQYLYAYLMLPDSSAVEFRASQKYNSGNGRYWYTYHVTGIYDPHGLKTTIDSEVVNNTFRRIKRVTEPAGRYLLFTYSPNANRRISQVQEYINGVARRSVQYYYSGTSLSSVVYYGNSAWTARYQYTASNIGGGLPLLLRTCDDPMYAGPMHKIAYTYRTTDNYTESQPGYGQISSENYYDGTTVGAAVSTLTVPSATTRVETRSDTKTRSFTYTAAGYLTSCTDFMSHSASQTYDGKNYINSVTDRNNHRTDYTNDPITGYLLQIQFPFTHEDTPNQSVRPTINYAYGGAAGCHDPNNQNLYWVCTATDEAGNETRFSRDRLFYRVTRIDYPDLGYETISYDAAHFYQISTHRMKTGGTERFAYDAQHRLQYYSDPYHSNPDNPSTQYFYDGLNRISGTTDALSHSTNFDYNDRGQVTLTTLPWINQQRYTIANAYNNDGTLQRTTDQLSHITSYIYDDYRRLKSVTPPVRGAGDSDLNVTHFYYGANPWDDINDYKYADSNVTYVVPPSTGTRKIKTVYDDNRRKILLSVAPGTVGEANTTYVYDNTVNVTWLTSPGGHYIVTEYDARNRPSSVSDFGRLTSFTYDTAGRRKTITRPNGQLITYNTFDAMNRVTQQTATQTPDPNAVTSFTYYTTGDGLNAPVGLLKTMKDPRLVALNSTEVYTYEYDLMGRKTKVTYPRPLAGGLQTNDQWAYDTVGRLYQFTNRNTKVQTFSYDPLNRMTGFSWNDGGLTPSVTFGYDEASRLIEIDNANANISRSYYNDNLLHMETQSLSASGGLDNRHVTYTYNQDGNPESLTFPGFTFDYVYTNRNQVQRITDHATGLNQAYYEYNTIGNVTLRNVYTSPVSASNYSYDSSDRITSVTHTLNGTTRTHSYGYYDNSYNWKYAKRGITPNSPEANKGEVFGYDLADQATVAKLNILNPDTTSAGNQTIFYDANGNRTTFSAYGVTDTYTSNNLNQYTKRNSKNASYNPSGTMSGSPDSGASQLTCTYDAQNRMLSASKNGMSMNFMYDGLNRQVSRSVNGQPATYSTWDGWNLLEEYTNNPLVIQARYLYGPTGLVKELQNNRYYCQDGSGSTSHLLDSTGHLLEWYRYDLQGAPFFYNASDTQLSASALGVRHLFSGQQWHKDVGLYDLRNRFYSPDLGRFLQPDPIGFEGDATNLYRYSGNNPVMFADPSGLRNWKQIGQGSLWVLGGSVGILGLTAEGALTGPFALVIAPTQAALSAGALAKGVPMVIEGFSGNTTYSQKLPSDPLIGGAAKLLPSDWSRRAEIATDLLSIAIAGRDAFNDVNEIGRVLDIFNSLTDIAGRILGEDEEGDDIRGDYNTPSDNPGGGTLPSLNMCYTCAVGGAPSGGGGWPFGIFQSPYNSGTYLPGSYGYPWGDAPWAYGQNPLGAWGNGGNFNVLGSSIDSRNQGLWFAGNTWGEGFRPPDEPGCFVAGTPVLMADGSEKPIEDIKVGEAVLAWNEETKTAFSTTVVKALRHDAKPQTLFDVQLENGQSFTVNNDHPIYVLEDNDFVFTDELPARFAKGQPITFQDSTNRPVKVVSLRMRRETCKMYNLYVEGQGKVGHTYYANGILVHNFGAGNRRK